MAVGIKYDLKIQIIIHFAGFETGFKIIFDYK